MTSIVALVRSAFQIGLSASLQSLHYTLRRIQLERRYAPRPRDEARVALPPGRLIESAPARDGGRFRFERADLEIRFLTADLVRVTWEPGHLPLPYALARTDWPPLDVPARQADAGWEWTTGEIMLRLEPDGSLRFGDRAGRLLRESAPPERRGSSWTDHASLQPDEHVYGLGERTLPLDLRGAAARMWNRDPYGHKPGDDPIYLCIPVYIGQHSQGAYLVFYENSFPATFRFVDEAEVELADGALRYYFVAGAPPRAIERYTELTGRPPLPPRWALGYHQCRWGYRNEADVRRVAEGFRVHDLPLSAIHLDIDYMRGYRAFTVDPARFPDMPRLVRDCAAQGVRLVTIINPGVKHDPAYDVFRGGLEAGAYCRMPDGELARATVWPGWCVFPDFTDSQSRAWWGSLYTRLLRQGIAGFWHDMNEPATTQAWGEPTLPSATRHALEGRGGDHHEAHNVYGLLMDRAGYEALRTLEPEHRPFLLSRSGWAGVQRYAWTWTADTQSTWENLRQTVVTALGLALSGVPYTGPDIGGFGDHPTAELYIRWLQLAAFAPFFRTHCVTGLPPREPWAFGEPALGIAREFLKLRYRLMPFWYTLAWQASRTGWPLVRPLFWQDAGDARLQSVDDTFLLGDTLLVAPILAAGATARAVTLPAGLWYSFWDDAPLHGPGDFEIAAPLDRIPILVRAGRVVPMEEAARLELHVYGPEAGDLVTTEVYSDAGDGYGDWRVDRYSVSRDGETLTIASQSEGAWPFPYARVDLVAHGVDVRQAWVDGVDTGCAGNRLTTGEFRQVILRT